MLTAHIGINKRIVKLTPGWLVFLVWAKDRNIDIEYIKKLPFENMNAFLSMVNELVEEGEDDFWEYASDRQENEEELSSYLFSFLSEKNN